jgi:glutamate--cysteine ligase catalytic subunit
MIEAVPRDPYGGYISDLLLVEKNMQLRRKRLHAALNPNEIAPTTANFPMMGVEGYAHTEARGGAVANSKYLADDVINPHPRFGTLTQNIRQRRQSNVNIQIPAATSNIEKLHPGVIEGAEVNRLFDCCDDGDISLRDVIKIENEKYQSMQSLNGVDESAVTDSGSGSDTIHMDAMAFGMGCCCLQVTMQVSWNSLKLRNDSIMRIYRQQSIARELILMPGVMKPLKIREV